MILSAAGACNLALNGNVKLRQLFLKLTYRHLDWVTRQMHPKWTKLNTLNMLLVKSAVTVLYSRAMLMSLLEAAHCLLERAGALHTLRKLNFYS